MIPESVTEGYLCHYMKATKLAAIQGQVSIGEDNEAVGTYCAGSYQATPSKRFHFSLKNGSNGFVAVSESGKHLDSATEAK